MSCSDNSEAAQIPLVEPLRIFSQTIPAAKPLILGTRIVRERQQCKDYKWLEKEREEEDGEGYDHHQRYRSAFEHMETVWQQEEYEEQQAEERRERRRQGAERQREAREAQEARAAERRQQRLNIAAANAEAKDDEAEDDKPKEESKDHQAEGQTAVKDLTSAPEETHKDSEMADIVTTEEAQTGEKRGRKDSEPEAGNDPNNSAKQAKAKIESEAKDEDQEMVDANVNDRNENPEAEEESEEESEEKAAPETTTAAAQPVPAAPPVTTAAAPQTTAAAPPQATITAAPESSSSSSESADEESEESDVEIDQDVLDMYGPDDEYWIGEDPEVSFEEMAKGGFRVLMEDWSYPWDE
ncbi:MAG: hypothetical protein L6R37_008117 [Teloschistes peruensis]|nr:MAG: hypothetical protein L6R37_008117 [Teloschistes peruensis]